MSLCKSVRLVSLVLQLAILFPCTGEKKSVAAYINLSMCYYYQVLLLLPSKYRSRASSKEIVQQTGLGNKLPENR